MGITIIPYTQDWVPAVVAFNVRLQAGGMNVRFPETPTPAWLPRLPGRSLYQEYFLAVSGDAVRGAYILKSQEFVLRGDVVTVGNLQLPISEGTVDKAFAAVGLQLLSDALRRQPLLYSLGIGGSQEPLTRLLRAVGWSIAPVPFVARVHHPVRFLREITYLRKTSARRALLDTLAISGLGAVGIRLGQALAKRSRRLVRDVTAVRVSNFETWADALWHDVSAQYSLAATRSSAVLNILYPAANQRFIILKIRVGQKPVGWAVLLATPLSEHRHFGKMKLGSIVDNLALPGYEAAVTAAATDWLEHEDVDLIVSNQAHAKWVAVVKQRGYFQGPSNFLLAISKALTERLAPLAQHWPGIHMNRGDGDGPIHL